MDRNVLSTYLLIIFFDTDLCSYMNIIYIYKLRELTFHITRQIRSVGNKRILQNSDKFLILNVCSGFLKAANEFVFIVSLISPSTFS